MDEKRIEELKGRLMTHYSLFRRAKTQKKAEPHLKEIRRTLESLRQYGWEEERIRLFEADVEKAWDEKRGK